jgi:membrane protease YdiL (CAAX protease family)
MSDLFLLPDGRLRAGWRLALFVVVFVGALFVVSLLVSFTRQVASVAVQVVIMAGATGSSTWLMLRWMEGKPFVAVGLVWKTSTPLEITQGFAVALALAGGVTAIEWGIGAIRFESRSGGEGSSVVFTLLLLSGLLALGATTEEVLFRGYAFQRLVEGSNGAVAILVSSVVFGWVHLSNPHATSVGALNTVLAGALLGIAYLKTRALWWPIGFHFGWNWALAVMGHPVSGLEVAQLPWQIAVVSGPVWVHGGSYGPEGGAVATAVLVLGTAGTLHLLRKGEAPRSLARTQEASIQGESS